MSTTVSSEPELLTPTETFRRRIWMACIWSWPVCAVFFGVSFVVVAGFLPPVLESASAADVAAFYDANRTAIRAGLIGAMFASALQVPFFAVISAEMRKIEGPNPLLAPIQYGGAIILVTFFQMICLFWLVASFRPEISPEIIRAFNDYGWLVWEILIPTYSLQFVAMAIAAFIDQRPHPIWPRWAAYMNIWVAVTGAGGVLSVYLKTGPFSWNGIIGIWIPLALFVIGMTVNMWLLHRRASYEVTLTAA